MLHEIVGDLVNDESINIFCHQTNCRGMMGAGIAKKIAEKYPVVQEKDTEYCKGADRTLLGTNLYIPVSKTRTCVNMYAQYNFGKTKIYTEYPKFQKCLNKLAAKLNISSEKLVVGFPARIGCGNAGGDWNIIYEKLAEFAEKVKQDVYIVAPKPTNERLISLSASFIGNSPNISNQWHDITVLALAKSYLVTVGNVQRYYSSKEAFWKEWLSYEQVELPNFTL